MSYAGVKEVKVSLDFGQGPRVVGRLAVRERKIYFEYERSFLDEGLELSPYKLKLQPGVQTFDPFLFEGLPGLFNDSLPDGWGKLLLDRTLRSSGILPEQLTPLDRLTHVGHAGLGALIYEPDIREKSTHKDINLDTLAENAQHVLKGEAKELIQELLSLNGSSAGARPKALVSYCPKTEQIAHGAHELPEGFEPWLVKFPNSDDGKDAGATEYVYALMAQKAGIDMMETRLLSSETSPGFFASRRFDNDGARRVHTHTACGLLHADYREPSLDYEGLLALTANLTRDIRETEKMYRLAVFNVLAHNRDDHSKNFTFLMNEQGEWRLSPAYDLTFSTGINGEQTTMVLGEGKNPGAAELLELARGADIDAQKAAKVIEQTQDALSEWESLAKNYGVSAQNIKFIKSRIKA
jgi:serine/threonine-protein kinase HipA